MPDLTRLLHPPALPARPGHGHKGMFGRVLVVGGNEGMIGAPVFAATAALRMGAGLVQLAVPRSILHAAISLVPECTGLGLGKSSAKDDLLKAAEAADAIVIGPGLGQKPEATARLTRLIRLEKPMVLDADALNLIGKMKRWPSFFKGFAVLTPHPGEMQRLAKLLPGAKAQGWHARGGPPSDEKSRIAIAAAAANAFNQVILLKGHRTIVTNGNQLYINGTGDSTLAKGGSGDILSGMIGTLLAQQLSTFDAAAIAAHIHGLAGEICGKKFGTRSALAREVLQTLPEAIQKFEKL